MTAEYALQLLNPIPEEDFTEQEYSDGVSKCCFVGHLVRLTSGDPANYSVGNCADYKIDKNVEEVNVLREKSREYISKFHLRGVSTSYDLAYVNNEFTFTYRENTPKARVMHLLDDMIAAGY